MSTYPANVTRELAFDGVIKKGDKSVRIRRAQEWLSIHGCPTPVDGDYGPATETCVRDFQHQQGGSTTGIVNKMTWDALTQPLNDALKRIDLPAGSSVAQAMLQVARQHLV